MDPVTAEEVDGQSFPLDVGAGVSARARYV